MLEENQLASRLQDSSDASKRLYHTGNCTERKGTEHRIDGCILQGNLLPRNANERDVHFGAAPLPFGEPNHPCIRLQRIDLGDPAGVVVDKVDTRTDNDLQDRPWAIGTMRSRTLRMGFGSPIAFTSWG